MTENGRELGGSFALGPQHVRRAEYGAMQLPRRRGPRAAGLPAPRVVLVDRGEVAGNWSGRQGYTSGLLPLGTPPEKDVGYPYPASWGAASADVAAAMAEFSWQRHLIRHGVHRDWVDRGRMRPAHRQWSAYSSSLVIAAPDPDPARPGNTSITEGEQ